MIQAPARFDRTRSRFSTNRARPIREAKEREFERLQAELNLAEALLRTESSQLAELEEKRRMLADGIAEIEAPSELWDRYLQEVDDAIAALRARIAELAERVDRAFGGDDCG